MSKNIDKNDLVYLSLILVITIFVQTITLMQRKRKKEQKYLQRMPIESYVFCLLDKNQVTRE